MRWIKGIKPTEKNKKAIIFKKNGWKRKNKLERSWRNKRFSFSSRIKFSSRQFKLWASLEIWSILRILLVYSKQDREISHWEYCIRAKWEAVELFSLLRPKGQNREIENRPAIIFRIFEKIHLHLLSYWHYCSASPCV